MKPRKEYHRNHSKADELEDVCKPCKAQRDAARRRNRATVSNLSPSTLVFSKLSVRERQQTSGTDIAPKKDLRVRDKPQVC